MGVGAFPEKEFGQLRTQERLAKIALGNRTDYWGGSTYVFMGRQLSTGSNSNHEYDIEIQDDSEMELLWGYIQPESTTSNCFVTIQDALNSGDLIGTLMGFRQVIGGIRAVFPDRFTYASAAEAQIGYGGTRIVIPSGMFLHVEGFTILAGERSRCVVVGRVRGKKPTAHMTGASGVQGEPALGTGQLLHDEFH